MCADSLDFAVIVVVGANKIVPTYADAVKRTEEYCLPLESARVRVAYAAMGVKASSINNFGKAMMT